MITNDDVISIEIPKADIDLIHYNAKEAEIGGISQVRSGSDRKNSLSTDQMVGQIANYAGVVYLTESINPYQEIREQANQNKYEGDNGVDIPGYRIDIKGSLMRASNNPLGYRLPVRPKERHPEWVYILAMIDSVYCPVAHLVGWAMDDELPEHINKVGVFQGAFTIFADELRPMLELKVRMEEFKLRGPLEANRP